MAYAWYVRITYKDGVFVDKRFPDTDAGARAAHHEWIYYSQGPWPGCPKDLYKIAFVDNPERRLEPESNAPPFSLIGQEYRNVRFVKGK